MAKTIIVSNRLPVSITKGKDNKLDYKPSSGGLATGLGSIYKKGNNIWMGWPGLYFSKEKDKKDVTKELAKENLAPVFLTKNDIEKYYEGFSNNNIWPLFHYFSQYAEHDPDLWNAYKKVNAIFRDEVLKVAEDNDTIWIHDYQLMLLPEMIREKLPNATIAFFQHIPFPSYEIFRISPWREELLKGVLGADLIGFHTYDDQRHFMSSVSRIVGIDHHMGQLSVKGRMVTVDSFPMGIDYEKYANAAITDETQQEAKRLRNIIGAQKLILSIDRLDYSKGIPQRLLAFDEFLEKHPVYQGKVSLILLVVPSRDTVERYRLLKEEIELLVGRINGKYGKLDWTPIHYFYRSLQFSTLSALYKISEVALITPFRDGMNLVCKEFLASKLDKTGVLILSEMAGSAKELSDALLINPNDINQIVKAIHRALTMPIEEQVRHNEEMQNKLKRYNIHRWVEVFMQRLEFTKDKQKEMTSRRITTEITKDIAANYKKAKSRYIFLDYDGTLMPFNKDPKAVSPDSEVRKIIKKLSSDKKNKVVVISGRDRKTLHEWLGNFNISFIAEHGVWIKNEKNDWEMSEVLDETWKDEIKPILEVYVDRTPGSFIEPKDHSLVWHYRKAESGLGELRARELVSNLQYLTTNMGLQIMEGHKVIEIKDSSVNKGKSAVRLLNQTNGKNDNPFIIALGDDRTDEDTFHSLPKNAFTIKVGYTESTEARYKIKSPEDVRILLKELAKN